MHLYCKDKHKRLNDTDNSPPNPPPRPPSPPPRPAIPPSPPSPPVPPPINILLIVGSLRISPKFNWHSPVIKNKKLGF